MKKPNVMMEILKLLGCVVLGWFLWVCIFSMLSPQEAEDMVEPFNGASTIFGILTGLVIALGLKFNALHRMKQRISALKSNIRIVEERGGKLLDKANRVVDKYIVHEERVQIKVAYARADQNAGADSKSRTLVKNATEFKNAVESYPELKANESIMELLKQIQDCENTIASVKMDYNANVENYNANIHSFPAVFFRRIAGFKDMDYLESGQDDDLVSDEALGI